MFAITTDTACDIKRGELKRRGIAYIPMAYCIDGVTYYDEFDTDEEYDNFYSLLKKGAMPTTTQINPAIHEQFFEEQIAAGKKEILHITLSSGLSATYDSAVAGAKTVMENHPDVKIYVVDSLGATQAQSYVVDKADEFRQSGFSAEETANKLNDLTKRLQVWVIAEDLFHLKRGGRVSAVAAVFGTALNIKPLIILSSDGKLLPVEKAMGMRNGLSAFIKKVKQYCSDMENGTFYIAQANTADLAEELTNRLRENGAKGTIKTGWIGPVIGSHTGGGTIGLIFEGEPRIK